MKEDELKNIILDLFDDFTDGFDLYTNPNTKSLWGIFTDEKRWIFELTNDGTLWYNYNFFTSIFKYLSLDVTENQHYITEWVEDTIQNGVKNTYQVYVKTLTQVEDTIQNGVKNTYAKVPCKMTTVEDTIQNGVKKTLLNVNKKVSKVEDTIQNGIKESRQVPENNIVQFFDMQDTIDNGIKNTYQEPSQRTWRVGNTITSGIKHTEDGDWLDYDERINDIIKNTRPDFRHIYNPMTFEPIIKEEVRFEDVTDILKNGIKQVKELPDKSGELRGYSDYYCKQEDITKPHVEYVSDVIKDGIKITKPIDYSDNTEHIVEGVLSRYTKQEIHK